MKQIKKIIFALFSISIHVFGGNFPTFHEGMDCANTYKPEFIKANHWKQAQASYESFVNNPQYQSAPKIPKIIHQIWIGSSFPEKCVAFQNSWKKYHPDWEYKLWSDQDIKALKLTNQHLYDRASNYGEKSDIARYEILYRFGGLYIDTDFECLKSFDLFHHTCSFYSGLLYPRKAETFNIANGLIGSVAGHPVLKECIETMRRNSNDNSPMAIIGRTGPYHFSACYRRLLLQGILPRDSVLLPVNFFYAFPAWERFEKNQERIKSWLKEYSYAVHYWQCSWQKRSLDVDDFVYLYAFGL